MCADRIGELVGKNYAGETDWIGSLKGDKCDQIQGCAKAVMKQCEQIL